MALPFGVWALGPESVSLAATKQAGVVIGHDVSQESEGLLTRLRATLNADTSGRAWQEGRGISLEAAIDSALKEVL